MEILEAKREVQQLQSSTSSQPGFLESFHLSIPFPCDKLHAEKQK